MGNTEQEQAESMKRYMREVFVPEYAKNFNNELSETDVKFYGKIHFDRSRSENELNMHLIVSRKDRTNKKKLSRLTNHRNTKKGTVTGGFDRINLFQQIVQGFDGLFNYNRPQTESFDYHNTMKNRSVSKQLKLQEQEFQSSERKAEVNQNSNQENLYSFNLENKKVNNHTVCIKNNNHIKLDNYASQNTSRNPEYSQFLYLVSSKMRFLHNQGVQKPKPKKKKIRYKRFLSDLELKQTRTGTVFNQFLYLCTKVVC